MPPLFLVQLFVCRRCRHLVYLDYLNRFKDSNIFERANCRCDHHGQVILLYSEQDAKDLLEGKADFEIRKITK